MNSHSITIEGVQFDLTPDEAEQLLHHVLRSLCVSRETRDILFDVPAYRSALTRLRDHLPAALKQV